MKQSLVFVLLLTFFGTQAAQNKDSVKDLSWMAGTWTCQKWGGEMTEVWSAPNGNSVMGMFSHVKDGKPTFYEFMTFEKNADGMRFYLRHFNPKSVAWEDKSSPIVFSVSMPGQHEVVMERIDSSESKTRLIYKLESPDRLNARLEKIADGKPQIESFDYIRKK